MDTWTGDPNSVIASEIRRHSTNKKRQLTIGRENFRREDIDVIKRNFSNVKTILCIGCRDDSEIKTFINSGFDALGIDVSIKSNLIRKCDAHNLTQYFDKVDFVYASHSLEHMHSPEIVLKNIRQLNPYGVCITLPFQPRTQGSILKHATLFEIMKVNDLKQSIHEIRNKKEQVLKDLNHSDWDDFKGLGNFELLDWKFRQLPNIIEKEIVLYMRFK